jgi:hypothetical protein
VFCPCKSTKVFSKLCEKCKKNQDFAEFFYILQHEKEKKPPPICLETGNDVQDSRSADEIVADIRASRTTNNFDVQL